MRFGEREKESEREKERKRKKKRKHPVAAELKKKKMCSQSRFLPVASYASARFGREKKSRFKRSEL